MEGNKTLMECILANSPEGYPKMGSEQYVEDAAGWNKLFSKHICFNPVSEVFDWTGEGTPVIIEDCDYIYLYFKNPDGTFEPVGCSWTYDGDGKIKNRAPEVKPEYKFSGLIITDVKKQYASPLPMKESANAIRIKTDKKLKDFYNYICSGDRPSGGDYYLGFLNDEEWQLQIYSGKYQVNFCKRGSDNMFNPEAAMIFDPTYGDVRFAKVDEHCRADYDNMTLYSMDLRLDDVNWTYTFGIDVGISLRNIIATLLEK